MPGRPSGAVHVCWPFRHPGDLVPVVRDYVAEGLSRRERVIGYLPEDSLGGLETRLGGSEQLTGYHDRGQLRVLPTSAVPAIDQPVDVPHGLDALNALVSESLDAGFTGLRMFADMTAHVRDPVRRARYVQFEHLADRICVDRPLSSLCAYDRTTLGDSAVAELACVHPAAHGGLSPFQLFASPRAHVALSGSVDTFSASDLELALRRIGLPPPGEHLAVDVAALEFIDHRALLGLDRYATDRRTTVGLLSAPGIVARLVELLPLSAVRLERTG
jgi:MEDS: MEthanogen/methylotroph, DcmR Sensory domain